MRIVIWNCNMALHDKYEHLLSLAPDVAVIPECADIDIMREKAPKFLPSSSIWFGDNRHKGIGVFSFGAYGVEQSDVYQSDFPHIGPVRVDGPTRHFPTISGRQPAQKKRSTFDLKTDKASILVNNESGGTGHAITPLFVLVVSSCYLRPIFLRNSSARDGLKNHKKCSMTPTELKDAHALAIGKIVISSS